MSIRRQVALTYGVMLLAIILPYVWVANAISSNGWSLLNTLVLIIAVEALTLGVSTLAYMYLRHHAGSAGRMSHWEPERNKSATILLCVLFAFLFFIFIGHILLRSNIWKISLIVADVLDFTDLVAGFNLCMIVMLFLTWCIFQERKRMNR